MGTLQCLYNLDIGIEEAVQAICQARFLLEIQVAACDGLPRVALLETHVGEGVDGHLNLRFRVLRLDELHDLFARGVIKVLQGSL